ncbi:MAG: hydrolase [Acidobacteria bacterium]|nr:MAG: hydrolase [Acidobacteriota bacterium]
MRVALVQTCSTEDRGTNLQQAETLFEQAARGGADLVALPENFLFLRSEGSPVPEPESLDGPIVNRFARQAKERRVWLLLGSFAERIPGSSRVHNTSVLIDRAGEVRAVYRKVHLFDIDMQDGPRLRESDAVDPGERVVVAETEFGPMGLSICYDIRFPELYRRQALAGARLLVVPSAFTDKTGSDHWHLLTRARAVENQCFLLAPAQWGRHSEKRASYGHSLIVDPWGRIVAEKEEGVGIIEAEIDLGEVDRVRKALPALTHIRPWLIGGQ